MNLFEKATKNAFRFPSTKGELTVEDLWRLPLTSERGASLNETAITLHQQIQKTETLNFVGDSTPGNVTLAEKLELVKYIIADKKATNARQKELADKLAKKQQLLDILDKKKLSEMESMSVEDLEKELAALG